MGRHSSAKQRWGKRKGAWTKEEDALLTKCVEKYGEGKWKHIPLRAGLNRCRKSCRLRWLNYLRPDIKRGAFAEDETDLIIRMHKLLGNRWALIAGRIPGRTANSIKNYWNFHLSKLVAKQVDSNKSSCSKVIKPLPRSFKPNTQVLRQTFDASAQHQQQQMQEQPASTRSGYDQSLFLYKEGDEINRMFVAGTVEGMGSGTDPSEFACDEFRVDSEFWTLLETP